MGLEFLCAHGVHRDHHSLFLASSSASSNVGISMKLFSGGGEDVAHSEAVREGEHGAALVAPPPLVIKRQERVVEPRALSTRAAADARLPILRHPSRPLHRPHEDAAPAAQRREQRHELAHVDERVVVNLADEGDARPVARRVLEEGKLLEGGQAATLLSR